MILEQGNCGRTVLDVGQFQALDVDLLISIDEIKHLDQEGFQIVMFANKVEIVTCLNLADEAQGWLRVRFRRRKKGGDARQLSVFTGGDDLER